MNKPKPIQYGLLFYMKVTLIHSLIVSLSAMMAHAIDSSGQEVLDRKVTIQVENTDVKSVLLLLEEKAGVSFTYRPKLIQADAKVSINFQDATLADVLANILNSDIALKVVGNQIALKKKDLTETVSGNNSPDGLTGIMLVKVSGKVTDETGGPLPGVNVVVKGTTIGTTTDAEGKYSLDVDGDNVVLVFSFIGYMSEEIVVGTQTTIDLALTPDITSLSEVVVVGYGTQSRKNLTSSITTVKTDELNRGSITDVGQLLQGKVPGLNITASGDPNKPAAVVLRGASTINSSQGPFYVIDGILGADIATVAPDDIASIDVLKDAAATAIYGNRAANGVIMITTRRGKKGDTQVSYSTFIATEKVSNHLEVMDATQLRDFVTKNSLAFTPADDKGANTDWQKQIERSSAFSQNHNLSIGGGTDHGSYHASLNYQTKEGILLNSDMKRVVAHISLEQRALQDKVKFGLNVTNSNTDNSDLPYRNTILLQSALYLPVSPIKNDDGTYFENFVKSGYYNPVAMLNHSEMGTKTNLVTGIFTTQVELPFGLTYDISLSYQNSSYLFGSYYDKYFTSKYNNMYDNPDPGYSGHTLQTFGVNGQATRSSYQDTRKILETFVTWNKEFGDHNIKAVVGYTWQDNVIGDGFQATTSNFPVDNITYNNLALSNPSTYNSGLYFSGKDTYQRTRLISSFARLNYNFKDRYLLQGSLRRDGSSVFGKNNRWGMFPSVGAAWRIGQEAFMQNQQIFSDLKLRVSYGVTGNSSGFNAYTAQFISGSAGTYYYNGVNLTAAYGPTQAANFDLQWEKTATTNIGLDFTILKDKVHGSIDVYDKKTTDMIYTYRVDPMLVPAGNIVANGGSLSNKGIELSVEAAIVSAGDFTWNTGVGITHNKNEITKLTSPSFIGGDSVNVSFPEGGGQSGASLQLLKEGHPLGQFFTLQYAGKNEAGVSQYIDRNGALTTAPTRADYNYAGNAQPKLLLGWTNNFTYKRFDFNFFIRGVFGNKIFNATRADLFRPSTAMTTNILVDAKDELPSDGNAYKYSTRFIESGNYIRFDNATLGYNVKIASNYVKTLRVYTSVNNLFVITKFNGVDPEVNQGGTAPGVDYNNFYPKTRTFLVGAKVTF